jgi:hypothetical protein
LRDRISRRQGKTFKILIYILWSEGKGRDWIIDIERFADEEDDEKEEGIIVSKLFVTIEDNCGFNKITLLLLEKLELTLI